MPKWNNKTTTQLHTPNKEKTNCHKPLKDHAEEAQDHTFSQELLFQIH